MENISTRSIEKDSEKIKQIFDNISPKYDLLNHLLTLGLDFFWRKAFIKQLQPIENKTILDLATGTGDVALEMIKHSPRKIIGVDISPKMIEIFNHKIQKYKLNHIIETKVCNATKLTINEYFDIITIAFGIRNIGDVEATITQLHRILKPDGKIGIIDFFRDPIYTYRFSPVRFYANKIIPRISKIISKNKEEYEYLLGSIENFYSIHEFENLMMKFNFKVSKKVKLSKGLTYIVVLQKF